MGFNTTILVLNDGIYELEQDKDLGSKIGYAINQVCGKGEGVRVCNALKVVETHHADGWKLILVGGNTAIDLGYAGSTRTPKAFDSTNNEDLAGVLNTVLRSRGLRVTKNPMPRVKKKTVHKED
jgi:hypothetical protein